MQQGSDMKQNTKSLSEGLKKIILNPFEILWHDIKQAFDAWKPSSLAEVKQFSKEWAQIPPQRCEGLIASSCNCWITVR